MQKLSHRPPPRWFRPPTTFGPIQAQNGNGDESKIQQGFTIAPVPLNLAGKNRELVGLGSYIVNTLDCNGCHDSSPVTEFTPSGNPYLLPPLFSRKKQLNPATYLGGGTDFGALVPGSAHIVSRNLTLDKTGRPEGGTKFGDFLKILRTGVRWMAFTPPVQALPTKAAFRFRSTARSFKSCRGLVTKT